MWKLTWLEIKIFLREPLGAIGTIGIPVLMFVVLGRMFGPEAAIDSSRVPLFVTYDLPVFTGILILLNAVLSLVTIISIYREGGILRRLRATPLRPYTILSAQVIVKLILNVITISLMVMAGRRYYPIYADVRVANFMRGAGVCDDEHPGDRISDRQHRPERAVRAADRGAHPVSDAGRIGPVLLDRRPSARHAVRRADACR